MKTRIASGVLAIVCAAAALPSGAAVAQTLPDYYPADYKQMVEASRKEEGLPAYWVMAAFNWKPVLDSFAKKYPWIKVETLDLNNELWDRYYTEKSSGSRTADFIAAFGIPRWLQASERQELIDYKSPEASHLPKWANPIPGAYALSADPSLIVWNKRVLPAGARPDTMEKIAQWLPPRTRSSTASSSPMMPAPAPKRRSGTGCGRRGTARRSGTPTR